MSSDETAKEALSFIFRTAQKAPKLFKTIKQVIDLIIGLNEEQRRKIELNNYAKRLIGVNFLIAKEMQRI